MIRLLNFVDHVNKNATKEHDRKFLKQLLEESGKTFDDLVALTNSQVSIFSDSPIIIANFTNGAHLAEMLANYIKEHGGGFYLNSRVTKIIDDGTKVSGLQVRNSAGEFTISAKAVVIATGGASYEKDDLLNKVTPSVAKVHVFNEASPANTGDGYSLLKAVNAEFSNNDVYKNGTIDFAPQLFITWNTVPDYSKTMLIDENGKRFSNEAPYNFLNLTDDFVLRNPNNILFKQRIFAYENFSIKYDYKFKSKQRMLFHISDWCHFGLKEDLKELFNIPLVKEPEFSRYFETHCKQVNDIHKPRLWKMSPEQYITSANAAKVFPSLNFETYLDRTDENTQISEEFIINNFRIFSAKDWGMACLKIPYNTYNIAVNSPFDYYSDVEQNLDYKKYCDPSIEIPDYKFLKQVFSLKYFESLRRHFLQLIFCPWIRKPSEIASTALYFFLFLFAL